MAKVRDKKLVLENGREFYGWGFGADVEAINELVFNTSMVGYQEIVSDPSNTGRTVVMTYPVIGNYGITDEDFESKVPTMGGLVVRDYNDYPSNFRATKTLSETLSENGIPAIYGVDTREITRIIRNEGSQKALIVSADFDREKAVKTLADYELPTDLVSRVSCKKTWYSRTANPKYNIVAVDCGIKLNIIRKLNQKGCNVTIVPYDTKFDAVLALKPDGLFISNGPGNPADVPSVIELVQRLQGSVPIFGICLGHQLIALANGAKTYKLKFGHRGGNHPVMNTLTGKIEITSQNHSYAVDTESLKHTRLRLTHINLLDNTAEGLKCDEDRIFSVQYHPESAPGPQDSAYLFDKFIELLSEGGEENA